MTLRCRRTGNPCGTDTWEVDSPCPCVSCCFYRSLHTIENVTPREGTHLEPEFLSRDELLKQIDEAETIEDLKEPLRIAIMHVFSKHYSSSFMDEPTF